MSVPVDHFHQLRMMCSQLFEVGLLNLEVRGYFDIRKDFDDPRIAVLLKLLPVNVDEITMMIASEINSIVVAVGAKRTVLVEANLANSLFDLGKNFAREHQLPLLQRRVPVAFVVESRANNHNRNHGTIRKKKINYF